METTDALMKMSSETCKAYLSFDNLMTKFYEDCCLLIQSCKQQKNFYLVFEERYEILLKRLGENLDEVLEDAADNKDFIKAKGADLGELRKKLGDMLDFLDAKENQRDKIKEDISTCVEKSRSLESLRNRARLLKIITSTSFDFLKESSVTGYTIGNDAVKPFSYEFDKMKQEEVAASLWSHLKNTFSEDYKNIDANLTDK